MTAMTRGHIVATAGGKNSIIHFEMSPDISPSRWQHTHNDHSFLRDVGTAPLQRKLVGRKFGPNRHKNDDGTRLLPAKRFSILEV